MGSYFVLRGYKPWQTLSRFKRDIWFLPKVLLNGNKFSGKRNEVKERAISLRMSLTGFTTGFTGFNLMVVVI